MSGTLRERRKEQTREVLAAAALDLFAARGYGAVTMADVAAAAGVGERTLYRHFADKEDLLFVEDGALRERLRGAIVARPADEPPFTTLRAGSQEMAEWLQANQDMVRRRAAVIAGAPALAARERVKHAAWEDVLVDALTGRGVPVAEARLLARVAVACFDEALARWLTGPGSGATMTAELDRAFQEITRL